MKNVSIYMIHKFISRHVLVRWDTRNIPFASGPPHKYRAWALQTYDDRRKNKKRTSEYKRTTINNLHGTDVGSLKRSELVHPLGIFPSLTLFFADHFFLGVDLQIKNYFAPYFATFWASPLYNIWKWTFKFLGNRFERWFIHY